jgi:hypothetical protein
MKTFFKLPAIIYRTYIDRGQDIPYFRTIVTIVSILFLHAVHVGLLFDIPSTYIMPWSSDETKSVRWVYGTIYFGILYTIISMVFKKNTLEKVIVTPSQIKRCKTVLPIYLIASIALLLGLLIKLAIEKGKI